MTHLLAPDVFSRATSRGTRTSIMHRRRRDVVTFGGLIVLALVLVALDRVNATPARWLRATLQDAAMPALRIAADGVMPIIAVSRDFGDWQSLSEDRNKLREENERLKGWEARARTLERQSIALAELTHAVREPALNFVTARVVSSGGDALGRGALIDAGEAQGLKAGYPVMSAQGLVGRLLSVGRQSARLLPLTDSNSRVPVIVGSEAARAVAEGDNGALPKLSFLQAGHPVKPGDEVVTSGVGGQLPRGLRVGTVVDGGDMLRIEPAAQLDRLQFVGVLFYDTPAANAAGEEPATSLSGAIKGRLVPSQSKSNEGALPR